MDPKMGQGIKKAGELGAAGGDCEAIYRCKEKAQHYRFPGMICWLLTELDKYLLYALVSYSYYTYNRIFTSTVIFQNFLFSTVFVHLISGHGLANLTYNADQWETGLEELLRFAQDV